MQIEPGYFYHIKDEFFILAGDVFLMRNKENGGFRPHYLAVRDRMNTKILWMIPASSRYEKYKVIFDAQVEKYGRCDKIVLGSCGGYPSAFLIQNAFPMPEKYIDHVHTENGVPVSLHETTQKIVLENLRRCLSMKKSGIDLFFTDVDALYRLCLCSIGAS